MAKSLRSKTKRNFRRVKRESGVFAAADAARLSRLSSKLRSKLGTDPDGDVSLKVIEDAIEGQETVEVEIAAEHDLAHVIFINNALISAATMKQNEATPVEGVELDSVTPKKISTSGRRLSRRDAWRLSKGKPMQTKNADKLNRLGGVAAKRRAGRSHRRR